MSNRKTVLVRYGIPLGILLCAVVVVLLPLKNEMRWHLRHGFHVETNGTRMHIPFYYTADDDMEHGLLARMVPRRAFYGTEAPDYGVVRVTFAELGSSKTQPESWSRPSAWADRNEYAAADLTEGTATFAGRNGMCWEYKSRPVDWFWDDNDIGVSCWFGTDVWVHFHGTPKSLADFHEMLLSAKDLRGKH